MSATSDVITYAKRHSGVFTTREAMEMGLASSTLARRVEEGIFVRLSRGIYALPGTSTRPDVMMRAAGRLMGAVVSHETAGRMHGMSPTPKTPPTVTVSHRSTYKLPGLIVHQSTDLRPEHVVRLGGQMVTNPPRTILDLCQCFRVDRLSKVVDNALAGGIVKFDELVDLYLALTRRGKKGMRLMGEILAERADELIPQTVIEAKVFKLLADAGLPPPVKQFQAPWLEPINGRVDFAYVLEKIVLEADSRRWHGLFDAFEVDRRRDIAAQLAGWIVIRITWKMLIEDPKFVVDSVRRALEVRTPH